MTQLYYIQFAFMEKLVEHYNQHEYDDVEVMTETSEWLYSFNTEFNKVFGTRWDEITAETMEENGLLYVIYTFPDPEVSPESKYGIIVINREEHHADYYTLESDKNGWFVCRNEKNRHTNFGILKTTEENLKADFIERIRKRYNKE